ncbi:MAG TPA: hypothetical protein VD790_10270 [Thermoleophilaceae bacterium]|nr:hypothetical protein [Thermoleophilaceae bacterium]
MKRVARAVVLALALALSVPGIAHSAWEGGDAGRIDLPGSGSSGPGDPYPSTLEVSGIPRPVTAVEVEFISFRHERPKDVDVMLVGPGGQAVMLMSDVGGLVGSVDIEDFKEYTFTPTATASLPADSEAESGTYKPTDSDAGTLEGPTESLVAPAPAVSPGTDLSIFEGTDGNGTWSLYAADDTGEKLGTIDWGLRVHYAEPSIDLAAAVSSSKSAPVPGEELTLTAKATNKATSNATAPDVEMRISYVYGVTFESVSADAGVTCEEGPQQTNCVVASLPPGASKNVRVIATFNGPETTFSNDVDHFGPPDPTPDDNNAFVTLTQAGGPPTEETYPNYPPMAKPDPSLTAGTDEPDYELDLPNLRKPPKPKARHRRGDPNLRLDVVEPILLQKGTRTPVTDRVSARGKKVPPSKNAYFLSTDKRAGRDVRLAGKRKVPALDGGEESTGSAKVKVPKKAKPGTWYLIACADGPGDVEEASEKDNCRATKRPVAVLPPANPLDVKAAAGTGGLTHSIGPQGGTIVTKGDDGTRYTLSFPAGAVLEPTAVELTPVKSVAPFPLGRLAGAVRMSPPGLGLASPATLVIQPTAPIALEQQQAFGFHDDGRDFHLRPFTRDAKDLRIDVPALDGYGVAASTDAQRAGFWSVPVEKAKATASAKFPPPVQPRTSGRVPTGAEAATQQAVAPALLRERQAQVLGKSDGKLRRDVDQILEPAARTWYELGIKPLLTKGQTDPGYTHIAIQEYFSWLRSLALAGLEKEFARESDEGHELVKKALVKVLPILQTRCQSKPTAVDGLRFFSLWRTALMFLSTEEIDEGFKGFEFDIGILVKCAHFKFVLTQNLLESWHALCKGCNPAGADWFVDMRVDMDIYPSPGFFGWGFRNEARAEYLAADWVAPNCTPKPTRTHYGTWFRADPVAISFSHPGGNPAAAPRFEVTATVYPGTNHEQFYAKCDHIIDPFDGPMAVFTNGWWALFAGQRQHPKTEPELKPDEWIDCLSGPWRDPQQSYKLEFTPKDQTLIGIYSLDRNVRAPMDPCLGYGKYPASWSSKGKIELRYQGGNVARPE